jgi:protein SCO1
MRSKWLSTVAVLTMTAASALAQYPRPAITKGVGIDQKLNSQIPLDLVFRNEDNQSLPLRSYFGDKPVVLSLVYFKCQSLCPMSVRETATSLSRLRLKPGADYNVLVVSFDPKDTSSDAAEKKAEFARDFRKAGYGEGFHFLTGSPEAIKALTEAVGWRYRFDEATHQFVHAGGIMVATPEGRLSRYFYGIAYAPQDVRLALVEASKHKIGSPADYITLFCFHYDPATGKYTLAIVNLLKVAGCLTVVLLAGLIFMLIRNDKRRNAESRWKEVPHVG